MRTSGESLLVVVSVLLLRWCADGCMIAGADTGTCTDPSDFDLLLPFCQPVVQYTACLPTYQSLWYNHSALAKDKFVQQMYTKLLTQRLIYETNKTLHKRKTDEWGGPKAIVPRFVDNADCVNAFKNYFCWLNFPRCDAEGQSLLLCRSVCENYMTACQMSSDLWRCGEPKFVNGRSPEISTTVVVREMYAHMCLLLSLIRCFAAQDGSLVYYRAPFPGSPFQDYEVDSSTNKPLLVCTPSLENHAHQVSLVWWSIIITLLIAASL